MSLQKIKKFHQRIQNFVERLLVAHISTTVLFVVKTIQHGYGATIHIQDVVLTMKNTNNKLKMHGLMKKSLLKINKEICLVIYKHPSQMTI